jgi:hypothetical protein
VKRREPEPGARTGDELGGAGDHDLIGRVRRQCVRDREQRIGVADATLGLNATLFQPVDDRCDPRLRAAASFVVLG